MEAHGFSFTRTAERSKMFGILFFSCITRILVHFPSASRTELLRSRSLKDPSSVEVLGLGFQSHVDFPRMDLLCFVLQDRHFVACENIVRFVPGLRILDDLLVGNEIITENISQVVDPHKDFPAQFDDLLDGARTCESGQVIGEVGVMAFGGLDQCFGLG